MKTSLGRFIALAVAVWCVGVGTPRAESPSTIGEVAVEGARFAKPRAILSKVKARKGDAVSDPAFRADVDRLLETGLYDDVQVVVEDLPGQKSADGGGVVRVVFRVQERPLIRRIDFKGNKALSTSKLSETLASKVDEAHDRFKAAQDVSKILSQYRDEGHLDAKVESYTSLDPRTNKVILTFFIDEGRRVIVRGVTVEGVSHFSSRQVRRKLKKTRRKKVFKEDALEEDLRALVKAYRNAGYLEVKVDADRRDFTEDRAGVTLTLAITEGRRYTVGDVAFGGATLFSESELRRAVTLKNGALYEQTLMDETLRNLQDLYADKGYLRAEVVPTTDPQSRDAVSGTVNLRFDITESSVVRVDRIYVDGNTYTKENVIRREVLLKPGDVFAAGKMRRSVEAIYNLGFLDDVQVDLQQPRSPELADVVFSVKEGKPGILSAGAGYSSLDGMVGTVQVQHINFLGRAQRINVMWEFGRKRQNYELGWTDPWFLGRRMSLGVDLFDTVRTLPFNGNSFAYKKGNRGFGLRLGPRLTDRLSLIENYNYERVRVFDIDDEFLTNTNPDLVITPSDDIKSAFTTGIVYDNRDNYFDASRGGRYFATVQTAGGIFGGDLNFYKPEISAAHYFPTFWKFVLTLSARGSYVSEFPPTKDLPISELFRIGGVDTVRGYDIGEVGVDGGKIYTVLNAEYKFPLVQENKRTILQGAVFADLGGAWADRDDMTWSIGSQPNQMRAGVGFGIRFKTPVFPIRLDWGWGLNRPADQPKSEFYFTIGNIF